MVSVISIHRKTPQFGGRFFYLLSLVLAFPVLDLISAWLYNGGSFPQAAILHYLRDASIVATAMLCLAKVRLPHMLCFPIFLYFTFISAYIPISLVKGIPVPIVIPSSGTLLLPILLFLVGYYCLRSKKQLLVAWSVLSVVAVVSTIFGAWEIEHTSFWIDVVRLPDYMHTVKGVELGLEPETGLPWNFFGGVDLERRSAGLLSAPLAQGSFLAIIAVTSLAAFSRKWRTIGVLLTAMMLFGIWQSGTRGALIVAFIGIFGVLAASGSMLRNRLVRWTIIIALCFSALLGEYSTIQMTANFMDGSTIGHWTALLRNLMEFNKVVLVGGGIGSQGAIAAQNEMAVIGGGEGAIFSIAYQIGLPGALVFLWFYINCIRLLGVAAHINAVWPTMAQALIALMIGFTTTFVTSEHILTLSGVAALWLLVGGTIRTSLPATLHKQSPLQEPLDRVTYNTNAI